MRSFRASILSVLLTAFCLASSFSAAQDHKVLFEKALYAMQTQGDLNQAVKLFNDIIRKYPKEREYAAKSQLYIGICYEKMGLRDAQKAYQTVVKDYPDQSEAVKIAQEKLSALGQSLPAAQAPSSGGIRIRQVWVDIPREADPYGSASPDGRSFAYVTDNGDLMIRDLTSGINRRISNLAKDTPQAYAESPLWSPQGDMIAYASYSQSLREEGDDYQIRLYDIGTEKTRVLVPDQKSYPLTWCKDGKHLLIERLENSVRAFELVSVYSAERRRVRSFNSDQIATYGGDVSPDQRFIAYAASPTDGGVNYDLFVIDAATGDETCHIVHPANEFLLGWTPDGRYLLFQSNRTGTQDIWAQSIENGKPVSEPELIKSAVGWLHPLGFSSNGAFFYLTDDRGTDIYLAEVDFSNGRASKPQKLIMDHEGLNSNCKFSPDGRQLAYLTLRGTINPRTPNIIPDLRDTICLYSLDTHKSSEYATGLRMNASTPLRWSSDSRFVFFSTDMNLRGGKSCHKLDIRSGQVSTILEGFTGDAITGGETVTAAFRNLKDRTFWVVRRDLQTEADTELYRSTFQYRGTTPMLPSLMASVEKSIFLWSATVDNAGALTRRVFRRDLQTGVETDMSKEPLFASLLTLSPDNRFVAFHTYERTADGKLRYDLEVMHMEDGKRRVLLSGASPINQIVWSPDSTRLLISRIAGDPRTAQGMYELWLVPVEGGMPKKTDLKMPGLTFLTADADGKRIAFTSVRPFASRLWVMENYLPPARESKK